MSGSGRLLGSALRCIKLVEELARSSQPLGVSELARRTGADRRGTVHQQLQTLVAAGWVERLDSAQYRLTLRALEIGAAALEQADLGSRILPVLTELATRSGETAGLAVLEGVDALIAQRVESAHPLKADIKVGTRMPLATSASGRVLFAFSDGEQQDHLRRQGVPVPPAELVSVAQAQGYAWQQDELMDGMSSVAVPVWVPSLGETVALSLAAPSSRFELDRSVFQLQEAATEMSRLTGGAM